jgi:hypothetical protein
MDGVVSLPAEPSEKKVSLISRHAVQGLGRKRGLAKRHRVQLILYKSLISFDNFLSNLQATLKTLLNQKPSDFGHTFPTSLSTTSV